MRVVGTDSRRVLAAAVVVAIALVGVMAAISPGASAEPVDGWTPGALQLLSEAPAGAAQVPNEEFAAAPLLAKEDRTRIQAGDAGSHSIVFLSIQRTFEMVFCSGTIVGQGVILTAAHCMEDDPTDPQRSKAEVITVTPGKDGGQEPVGSGIAASWVVPSGWAGVAGGDNRFDVALVFMPNATLTTAAGVFPGQLTIFGLAAYRAPTFHATALGYPAFCGLSTCGELVAPGFPGAVYPWKGKSGFAFAGSDYVHFDATISPGMSGGPLVRDGDNAIIGVLSATPFGMFARATRVNEGMIAFANDACAAVPACSFAAKPSYRTFGLLMAMDTQFETPKPSPAEAACEAERSFLEQNALLLQGVLEDFEAWFTAVIELANNESSLAARGALSTRTPLVIAKAQAVQALASPNPRLSGFEGDTDKALGHLVLAVQHLKEYFETGSDSSINGFIEDVDAALLDFETAAKEYPGLSASCIK